ncbi:hypothetical protein V5799_031199 [Amblyomma americanum]|uniref:Secreted protein n=1 Tax=Amblyomma americanum TaxID=6943 RepID=A0AAQ4EL31_AMBAM
MSSALRSAWWLFATFLSTMVLAGAVHDPGSHLCPGGGECNPGTSCTPLLSEAGGYGCCPYERGVPCEHGGDKGGATGSHEQHSCCPEGHWCQNGTCAGEEGDGASRYAPAPMVPPRWRNLRSTTCRPREFTMADKVAHNQSRFPFLAKLRRG